MECSPCWLLDFNHCLPISKDNAIFHLCWDLGLRPRDHGWSGQNISASGSNMWLIHHCLDWVRTYTATRNLHFFLVLKGQEKLKQRPCPSQRHIVFKSRDYCVGREGAGMMVTTFPLHCSTGSDALCPHPLTNHQVHVIQACRRIILR